MLFQISVSLGFLRADLLQLVRRILEYSDYLSPIFRFVALSFFYLIQFLGITFLPPIAVPSRLSFPI
jgi:hypothetical protein